jgi:hypothetical protein
LCSISPHTCQRPTGSIACGWIADAGPIIDGCNEPAGGWLLIDDEPHELPIEPRATLYGWKWNNHARCIGDAGSAPSVKIQTLKLLARISLAASPDELWRASDRAAGFVLGLETVELSG